MLMLRYQSQENITDKMQSKTELSKFIQNH